MNDNAYTGPHDPINAQSTIVRSEVPQLYEVAKQVTFEAGFDTWTDPRNGKVYRNPKRSKRRKAPRRAGSRKA